MSPSTGVNFMLWKNSAEWGINRSYHAKDEWYFKCRYPLVIQCFKDPFQQRSLFSTQIYWRFVEFQFTATIGLVYTYVLLHMHETLVVRKTNIPYGNMPT